MALGCFKALRELGLRIPDEVAVMVGFDDREIARSPCIPPLSTVLLPHYEMAAIAAEWLFDLADEQASAAAPDQGRMPAGQARLGLIMRRGRKR